MSDQVFAVYDGGAGESLPALCADLFKSQVAKWPLLKENYDTLEKSEYRDFTAEKFHIRLQYNPGRMASASAKLDAKTIAERKCFLCRANLPAEQQGIMYGNEYLILCNPWPIFSRHLTVAHLEHKPQAIADSFPHLLSMSRDFAPVFRLFYNGPRSGASAPDHLHFQAYPSGAIPLEKDLLLPENKIKIGSLEDVAVFKAAAEKRSVIFIEGETERNVISFFDRMLASMKRLMEGPGEPMMNIVCSFSGKKWRVIVFPRHKFRPDAYYLEGEDKIMVSPGAVEMGGLVVTPRKMDFERLNADVIEGIYEEVSLGAELFRILQNDVAEA